VSKCTVNGCLLSRPLYQTLRNSADLALETYQAVANEELPAVGVEGVVVEDAETALQARLRALQEATAHALGRLGHPPYELTLAARDAG